MPKVRTALRVGAKWRWDGALVFFLALQPLITPAVVSAQSIRPDGRTATTVTGSGAVQNVSTATVVKTNAFNSFHAFSVPGGNVVNLHVPTAAANLINIVRDERTNVYGILNAIKDGRIGGNVWFANPHGFVVGPSGVVNVGSLTVTTPTQAFADNFFLAPGTPNEAAVAQLLAGTAPRSGTGLISIQGTVNAADHISLLAGTINVGGTLYSGARFIGSAPDFSDVVNANGLVSATNVVAKEGRIAIVADNDVAVAGTIAAPGGPGVRGGDISIRAGGNLELNPGANIVARGLGENSAGGRVNIWADNNAVARQGALVDASAGTSGNGGFIEFSAKNNVELAGGEFRAVAPGGRRGSVLIDPATATVSADFYSAGADHTITADDSITVNANVTVSTRNVVGGAPANQETAASAGDSGDLTLQAPSIVLSNGSKLLAHADGARTGGTVTLSAQKNDSTLFMGQVSAQTRIEVDGATVRGKNITIEAKSTAAKEWLGDPVSFVAAAADSLAGLALFAFTGVNVGVVLADGKSEILVKSGSVLDAQGSGGTRGTVSLNAETTATAASLKLGLGAFTSNQLFNAGFVYGQADATATVDVQSGASIKAGDLSLTASNTAETDLTVLGFSTKQTMNAAAVVNRANVISTATIASGASVDANRSVLVKARNTNTFSAGATSMALETGQVGFAVNYSELSTSATAANNAHLTTSSPTSVTVEAFDRIAKNKATASTAVGSSLIASKIVVPVLNAAQGVGDKLFGRVGSGPQQLDSTAGQTEKPKLAAAVTYADNRHTATASIGAGAQVTSSGEVAVAAKVSDERIRTHASSSIDGQSEPNNPGTSIGLSAAVSIGLFDHEARAFVGDNAIVTAPHIGVRSEVAMPYEITWAKWEGISTILSKLSSNLGIADGLLSGWANATTGGTTGASLAGAVTWMDFDNVSLASVGRGAQLKVSPGGTNAWSSTLAGGTVNWLTPVQVHAQADVAGVYVGGNMSLLINGAGGEPGATSVGGAYSQVSFDDTTRAWVSEGAEIVQTSGPPVNVTVDAQTHSQITAVAPSAGRGGSYGANIIFSRAQADDRTEASIDDEAKVTANRVDVKAKEDVVVWSLAGAFTMSDSAGVGAGVAMNDVSTDTKARIGDNDANNAGGSMLSVTTGKTVATDIALLARTDGRIEAIGVAGAAASSSDPADGPGFKDKVKSGFSNLVVNNFPGLAGKLGLGAGPGAPPVDSQPKFGLAVAGSAGVNVVDLVTRATVEGAKVEFPTSGAASLAVTAVNDTDITAAAGSASLVRANNPSSSWSAGVAGSVAVNQIANTTEAAIRSSNVTDAQDVAVTALAGGEQLAVAIGAAVNASADQSKSASAGGSVSVSLASNTTAAKIENSTLTGQAAGPGRDLDVIAYERLNLGTGGGSLIAGGRAGVGAAVSYSEVSDTIEAALSGSTVTNYDKADVHALTATRIGAGAAMGGVQLGNESGGTLGGAFAISDIGNTVKAEIRGGSSVTTASQVDVLAADTTGVAAFNTIIDAADGVDPNSVAAAQMDYDGTTFGQSASPGSSIISVAGVLQVGRNNVGMSFAYNKIHNSFTAALRDSTVSAGASGTVNVIAESNTRMLGIAAGVGFAADKFAGAGSLTLSETTNAVTAEATSATGQAVTAGTLTVKAEDKSKIESIAGQITISAGQAAVGAAVAHNQIANTVRGKIEGADIDARSATAVRSANNSTIRTLAAAGGGSQTFAFNGSAASALITNTTEAAIVNAKADDTTNAVSVTAEDTSQIQSLSGAVGLAGSTAVGLAIAVNRIDNTTRAHVSGTASVGNYGVKSLIVRSDTDASIESIAVGVGGGLDVGVAGSVATNFVDSDTEAYIDQGAKVVAENNVGVIAESDDRILIGAGAAGIGLSAAGVGASVTVNKIGGSTKAHISGAGTEVAARALDPTANLTVNEGGFTQSVNLAPVTDFTGYQRLDVRGLRRTESVRGVAVNASATHGIEAINVNVAGGQIIGVSGTTNVNIIGGETLAYVDGGAKINKSGTPLAGAGQAVSVKSSDHSYGKSFIGSVSVGLLGAGVGLAADVNVFSRNTKAYVTDSTDTRSAGLLTVDATSAQGASSFSVSGAGGIVGVVGTGGVIKFTGTTDAFVHASTFNVGALSVWAEHDSFLDTAGGGVTIGGIAASGTFAVGLEQSTTRAYIDGGSQVNTAGTVGVTADSDTTVRNTVVSGAGGGGAGIAGMAAVALVENTTQAYVQSSTLGGMAQNAGSVTVRAEDSLTVQHIAGAAGISVGGGYGVGAGAAVTKIDNTVSAFLDSATVHSSGGVTVEAKGERDLSTKVASIGVGGTAGIGGAAAVTLVGRALSGDANNELNSGGTGTIASVQGFANSDPLRAGQNTSSGDALTTGDLAQVNSAARTNVTASVYPGALVGKTSAQVAGSSSVTAAGDVKVSASEQDRAAILVGAAGIGGLAIGGAVGVMDITNNVEAKVAGTAQITSSAGKIEVLAEAGKLSPGDRAAKVESFQGSAGIVGLGAAVSTANVTNNITASVERGATTTVASGAGNVTVRATDGTDIETDALGASVGLVAAGAVIARSSKSGSAVARVGNTNPPSLNPDTFVDLASGTLQVQAERTGLVKSRTIAGTGGILAGSGSDARATDSGTSKAFLGNSVTVSGPSAAVTVKAGAEPNTFARAEGYSAAVFGAIGVSIAQATANLTVEASIGSGSSITAGTLEVNAANRVPGGGNTADSEAVASGGALLVGANGSESTAQSSANVSATIGNNTQLAISQATTVTAAGNTKEEASASGVTVGGLLAIGVNVANARANNTATTAQIGGVTGNAGASLSVTATGSDDTFAESMAGTGGLLAGGAALANTRNNSTTVAELGGGTSGSALTAGSVVMRADHTATFNTKVNTINAAVIGASGAAGNSDVDSNVMARFAAGANIQTQDLDVLAINFSRKPFLGGGAFNATAGAGGLFSGAAALSAADIDNATRVTVGDGAVVNVTGNRDNPGRTNLTAVNDLDLKDKTNLDVGGAIPVAAAESHLRGNSNLAEVTMGTGSRLDSVGNVNLGARVRADVEASANAKTYGLAGAAAGTSEARVNAVNSVVIGTNARIRADGDVNLMAGRDGAGTFNNVTARARTDLFNKTAFPIVTNPEADAIINQSSTVSVGTGASVGSVKDVNLLAENGSNVADGQGVGKDLWREAAAAVASFFSNLVGGGDVSLDIRGGSSTVNANSGVTVNGTVAAGIQNKQFLTIDQNGTPSLQTEGVRFTTSVENLVTNIFNEITRLSRARAAYAGNPDAQAALDAEIARLRAELADLGYADTANNNIPVETVNATFINLDDVKARGGNINVTGNFLAGSGSLSAPNDTEITIVNASPRFLRTKRLTIEDTGGRVTFNQAPVSTNADINSRNRIGSPAAGFSSVLTAGTSPAPTITVHNTYNPSIQGAGEDSRAPDIQITGDVTNFTGTVNITNDKGSVVIQGTGNNAAPRIVANTINITTGKNFVQSFVPGFFNVGGDPRSIWDGEADVGENANTANPGSIGSRSSNAGLVGTGSIVAGNNVFISARYLNLNGLVQAGIPDWSLTLDAGLDATIAGFRADYAAKVASGNKPANPRYTLTATDNRLGRIASFFNAESGQIELDGVKVEGGTMELFGEIVNTGGGRLRAVDGFGRINVVNNTSHDVVLNGLDVGNNIEAKIRITDTANRSTALDGVSLPIITAFTRVGNQAQREQRVEYVNTANQRRTLVLSSGAFGGDRTTQYNPVTGERFIWVTGLNRLNKSIGTASSTTVLGFIPAGSNQYSSYVTILLQAVPIQEQAEFTPTVKGASQANNYEYRFSQFSTTGVQFVGRREWSNCNAWFIVCLSRTYFVEDTFQEGRKDFHTHFVKGDFPIPIEFIGFDTGNINVTSGRSLVLAGATRNPVGSTTLTSTGGSISTTGSAAVITANDISLGAQTGIGTSALPIVTDLGAGALRATTTSGDVAIKEVKGDLRVDLVSTNSGNVSLDAESGIVAANTAVPLGVARVVGNRVDLIARTGGIGQISSPLNIQTQATATGGLNATAADNVNIRQPAGDLRLISVTSLGGDVSLEAAGGTFIDANTQEVRDTRAESQLLALWNDLRLRGAGAEQSRDDTIGALKAQRKRDYERYWNLRGVLPVFDAFGKITGFTAKAYTAGVNAELDALDAQLTALGISTASYDASFTYTPSTTETNDRSQGFAWTDNELKTGVSRAILFKATADTETRIEDPNVKGRNVTLTAAGGVGKTSGSLTIDGTKTTLTEAERIALAAAEPDDVAGDPVTKQITVIQRDDVDIEATNSIKVTAGGAVFLGSEKDLNIDNVQSGQTVRIKGGIGIFDVSVTGPAIQGASTILEASTGAIGTQIKPFSMDLTAGATLTARAGQDIFITERAGDSSVAEMFTTKNINLVSAGSILDARGARPIAIQSDNLNLTAQGGSVGTSGNPLFVNLGSTGQLTASTPNGAGNDVFVTSPTTGMNVGPIQSGDQLGLAATVGNLNINAPVAAKGNASLAAGSRIHVAATGSVLSDNGNITTNSFALTMVDGADITVGVGTISITTAGDAILTGISTLNPTGSAIVINSGGRVLDGGGSLLDMIASTGPGAKLTINAVGGIGNDPLDIRVRNLDATSTTGGIHLEVQDSVNVGAVQAAGEVLLTASGSITGNTITSTGGPVNTSAMGGQVNLANVSGQTGANVSGQTGVTLATVSSAGGSIAANSAAGNVNVATATANQNVSLGAPAGSITATGTVAAAGGSVTMSASGDVAVTSPNSARAGLDVALSSMQGSVSAAAITAGRDVNISAGQNVALGTVTAGNAVTADAAGGDLTANSITANGINLSALGSVFVPSGTVHVGSLLNLGADQIVATVDHTGTVVFLQANATNRGGGPASLVELAVTSPLGVHFGTFSSLDAALLLNSGLDITNGFIANRATITNPVTLLLIDQNNRAPQPSDIQLFSRDLRFQLILSGRVAHTDAFASHYKELTHSVISLVPGRELDVRKNVEKGLAIAEDAATARAPVHQVSDEAEQVVSYSEGAVALPDCTKKPLPAECR